MLLISILKMSHSNYSGVCCHVIRMKSGVFLRRRIKACIGLAILQKQWHKYLYLYDLKVNRSYRGQHIAARMVDVSCTYAKEHGYRGVWTIGQNNNLAACLFYVNHGFRIGGLDTDVYLGTSQEGKADIYFYRDAE